MIFSTTHTIENRTIKNYHGIVAAEVIMGTNFMRDWLASFSDFFGGRSSTYENQFIKAREEAFKELEKRADQLGANGVVGIDLDYGTVGNSGSMLLLTVTGTAVSIV